MFFHRCDGWLCKIATFTVLLFGAMASASPKDRRQGSHHVEHLPGQRRMGLTTPP